LHGTHAALGGMPRTGDIPKPLARDLLKMLTRKDWQRVDARFEQHPARHPIVRHALKKGVGLFVHPANAGLMGPAAFAAVKLLGVAKPEITEVSGRRVHGLLTRYASEGGALYGLTSLQLDAALSSFPGIDMFFVDFPACLNRIASYRMADDAASRSARQWMAKTLGAAYPARA
jgi:hypothetical protein